VHRKETIFVIRNKFLGQGIFLKIGNFSMGYKFFQELALSLLYKGKHQRESIKPDHE